MYLFAGVSSVLEQVRIRSGLNWVSGSRKTKNYPQRRKKVKRFNFVESCMFVLEGQRILRIHLQPEFKKAKNKYIAIFIKNICLFSAVKFSDFWASKPWIWFRIRFHQIASIRIQRIWISNAWHECPGHSVTISSMLWFQRNALI